MIVYAVNVNGGGGKVLLDRLLIQNPFEPTTAAFLDTRYSAPVEYSGKKFFFTILSRLFAEKKLHQELSTPPTNESVLFFGNLPPFQKPKVKSYLYLQNCFTTGHVPLPTDSVRDSIRSLVESWILKLFYKNVDEIWVQTEWMKELTLKQCPKANVVIKPFLPLLPPALPKLHKTYTFMYVGSLSANKGLSQFLVALKNLDDSLSKKIEVCIVLNNRFSDSLVINDFKDQLRNVALRIKYQIGRHELFKIYEKSEYFVAASLYESYYLPLYEALHFGCKIIARNDAQYIRNINGIQLVSIDKMNLVSFVGKK